MLENTFTLLFFTFTLFVEFFYLTKLYAYQIDFPMF